MNERIKKIILIVLLAAASAFFLYNGFALLFKEQAQQNITAPAPHSGDSSPSSPR